MAGSDAMKKLLQQSAQRKEQEIQSINNVAENTTPAPEKPVKEMVEEKSVEEKPVQEVTEKTETEDLKFLHLSLYCSKYSSVSHRLQSMH